MSQPEFNPDEFIYCKEHKIWYHINYKKKADEHRKPPEEDKYHMNMFVFDCPMCARKEADIMCRSIVTPEESAQNRELLRGPRVDPTKRKKEPFIWKEKRNKR